MNPQYYILWYRLNGSDSFLIWYSDEKDGVFVDADGSVPSFKDAGSLVKYAEARNVSVDAEEPILLDLDVLGKWLEERNVELIDPNSFNGAWNLFADVSRSINGGFDPDQELTQKIYDKLFWGCNLPAVTPEGKQYHPAWTRRELKIMHDVLNSGLRMFRGSVRSL
ncbi:MAG TPA: hypothetical protein VF656_19325 [Pyrinomonadaceae bacterium]|jgi:hypothetical protein